jgi:hypothetical protein
VITLGDLNDGPLTKENLRLAPKPIRGSSSFRVYNPFEEMAKRTGNNAYRDSWDILTKSWSQSLIQNDLSSFRYGKPGFTTSLLIQTSGQYKGYPKRHSATEIGFSDHFPVYIYLIREMK